MIPQDDKSWFDKQIKKLDPNSELIKINDSSKTIEYSSLIKSSENRSVEQDKENYVHALFLLILCGEAFKYKAENFYHEKQYSVGSHSSNPKQVDYLLQYPDGNPFALIELKTLADFTNANKHDDAIKTQLFPYVGLAGNPRLLILATIEPKGEEPVIKADVIDLKSATSYEQWVDLNRPKYDSIPSNYLDVDYIPYRSQSSKDLRKDCSQSRFKDLADRLHDMFFGEHPDNTLFLNLVKCLLAKIYDERQCKDGETYKFQILKTKGKDEDAKDLFDRVNSLYREAYARYIEPNAKQPSEIDPKEFSYERVKQVVAELQELSLTQGASLNGDIIGAFFESILRAGFKQDKGMYFTHANIARFMLEVIDLSGLSRKTFANARHPDSRLPYIIDPACGSGTFLMHAMQIISKAIRDNKQNLVNDSESKQFFDARMSDSNPNYWAERFVYGFDPKFIMAITTKVNMVLHGDGSAHIYKYDAFNSFKKYDDAKLRPLEKDNENIGVNYSPKTCESFDVVISNPPFGVSLAKEIEINLDRNFELPKSMPTESLFVERAFQLLKDGGRLALVLPESVFNSTDAFPVRSFLYRMFNIKAIVSLPRNIFIDTPTLTSLLFAQKKSREQILEWDSLYGKAKQKAEVLIKDTKVWIEKNSSGAVSEIVAEINRRLADVIPINEFINSRGRNPKITRFVYDGDDLSTLKEHYMYYLKTTPYLKRLIERYAFRETVKTLDYNFYVCRVEEIGYKLSKRGEKARPNQLCSFVTDDSTRTQIFDLNLCKSAYDIEIDTGCPKNALDYLRKVIEWD